MDKIKLIIWDLDETLYNGTLLEGTAIANEEITNLVIEAARHGIVSSICSKNDYETSFKFLKQIGIADYFVFPSIDFTPKGKRVLNIINDMKLKPKNVLFLDDNLSNLKEVSFYVPTINCSTFENAKEMLIEQINKSPLDEKFVRLANYKLLEKRNLDMPNYESNEEFLNQSNIIIEILSDVENNIERIYEMLSRTNQLNYTKKRFSLDQLLEYAKNSEYTSRYIKLKDKYGDYGIIGFYLLKDDELIEYAFSCRVLGMRVEQYIYSKLNYPKINIVGDVSAKLEKNVSVPWIREETINDDLKTNDNSKILLMCGGCPLRPIATYINNKIPGCKFYDIEPEPSILNLVLGYKFDKNHLEKYSNIGNIDKRFFDKKILQYKHILISLINESYCYKFSDNYGYFYAKDIDLPTYKKERVSPEIIEEELTFFSNNYDGKILILLSSEIVFKSKGKDADYLKRISTNEVARKLQKNNPDKFILIDLNNYAKEESDFFNNWGNHYNRSIGYKLAELIGNICKSSNCETNNKCINYYLDTTIESYIANDIFYAKTNKEISLKLLRNGKIIYENIGNLRYQLKEYGLYQIEVDTFKCSTFIFNEYSHYIYYFEDENKDEYLSLLKDRSKIDLHHNEVKNQILGALADLSANGHNINDIFIENKITKCSLFIDEQIGRTIIPFLLRDKRIKLNNVFCDSFRSGSIYDFGNDMLTYNDPNDIRKIDKDETLVVCTLHQRKNYYLNQIKSNKIVYLPYLLEKHLTYDFVNKIIEKKIPLKCVVRLPRLDPFRGINKTFLNGEERAMFTDDITEISEKRVLKDNVINLNQDDVTNKSNVEKNNKKLYLFGSPYLFGFELKNSKILTTKLNEITDYCIVNNKVTFNEKEYQYSLYNLFNTKYNKDDEIILFLSNDLDEDIMDRFYYLSYDVLSKYFQTIDFTEYLKKKTRKTIFVSKNTYTEEFYIEIAKSIADFLK